MTAESTGSANIPGVFSQLERSDQELALSSYFAPVPIFSVDEHQVIVDYNLAAQALFDAVGVLFRGQRWSEFGQRLGLEPLGHLDVLSSSPERSRNPSTNGESPALAPNWRAHTSASGLVDGRCFAIEQFDASQRHRIGHLVYLLAYHVERPTQYHARWERLCRNQLLWERYAVSYDEILPLLDFYSDACQRHIDALTLPGIRTVAEIGVGTGVVVTRALLMARRTVTGIDQSRAMLTRLRHNASTWAWYYQAGEGSERLRVLQQDTTFLPQFKDASFDGVSILLVLFDVFEPERALSEAMRIIRPGGRIVLTEPRAASQLEPLFKRAKRLLEGQIQAQGLSRDAANELRTHWDEVERINREFDPGQRAERLFAEAIVERLESGGFQDIVSVDSHEGNCATITANKSDTASS